MLENGHWDMSRTRRFPMPFAVYQKLCDVANQAEINGFGRNGKTAEWFDWVHAYWLIKPSQKTTKEIEEEMDEWLHRILPVKSRLKEVIDYANNPDKTTEHKYLWLMTLPLLLYTLKTTAKPISVCSLPQLIARRRLPMSIWWKQTPLQSRQYRLSHKVLFDEVMLRNAIV